MWQSPARTAFIAAWAELMKTVPPEKSKCSGSMSSMRATSMAFTLSSPSGAGPATLQHIDTPSTSAGVSPASSSAASPACSASCRDVSPVLRPVVE